jgi:hypothetical protein
MFFTSDHLAAGVAAPCGSRVVAVRRAHRESEGNSRSRRSNLQWIDLRENLQETMVFTIKYRAFL